MGLGLGLGLGLGYEAAGSRCHFFVMFVTRRMLLTSSVIVTPALSTGAVPCLSTIASISARWLNS